MSRVGQLLTPKLLRWLLPSLLLLWLWPIPVITTVFVLRDLTFSKGKLSHPNPSSYVFHVPVEELRKQLPWRQEPAPPTPCPALPTPCLVLERPSNGTDYFTDQLERTPSDVYHLWGKPLPYKAEYTWRVTALSDSETLVNVSTTNAEVMLGSNFINGSDVKWVEPTTIEEYRILQLIGNRIGEPGIPPLQLPR
jgi:hypothetical protein